jgi:hypothetical protein
MKLRMSALNGDGLAALKAQSSFLLLIFVGEAAFLSRSGCQRPWSCSRASLFSKVLGAVGQNGGHTGSLSVGANPYG